MNEMCKTGFAVDETEYQQDDKDVLIHLYTLFTRLIDFYVPNQSLSFFPFFHGNIRQTAIYLGSEKQAIFLYSSTIVQFGTSGFVSAKCLSLSRGFQCTWIQIFSEISTYTWKYISRASWRAISLFQNKLENPILEQLFGQFCH